MILGNTELQIPVVQRYRYIDIDRDDIDMDTAIVQWDMCLSLRRETGIEDRNLGVINEELKTEIKELWIAKENICSGMWKMS